MKIIVTGGAGFIGSALVRHLIQTSDAHITVIDKLTYAANLEALAEVSDMPSYRLLKLDICDQAAMRKAFDEIQPDRVFHLAAESHVDRSITGPQAFAETNLMGTYSLLEAARQYWQTASNIQQQAFRFLHVSTDEVFGSLGADGQFSETSPYDPSSPYSASKAGSDHLAKAWARTYGLPVIISNCSNNYGPYQFPEKLIPLTILNGLEGQPLPIYGDGLNIRDWLHVDDHVRALELIAGRGQVGETYMVGGLSERTNLQVVEAICDTLTKRLADGLDRRDLMRFVEDRPGHDRRYAVDPSRLIEELGWKPERTFESGLEQTVDWYLQHRDWWQKLRSGVYSGERLGLIEAPDT